MDMKRFFLIVILVCIFFISLSGYLIFDELYSAKVDCEKINGTHTIKGFEHFCNNESYYRYSDNSWDFERVTLWDRLNLSKP